jgi:hypothetical protein
MFRVEVRYSRLIARLNTLEPRISAGLQKFAVAFSVRLVNQVKTNIVALFRSTGPLYQSIQSEVTIPEKSVRVKVFSEGVEYAGILERGGVTRAHTILPRTASVLAFEGPAGLVFAKRVNHPGSVIPARPYVGLALSQLRSDFRDGIREVVATAQGETL